MLKKIITFLLMFFLLNINFYTCNAVLANAPAVKETLQSKVPELFNEYERVWQFQKQDIYIL